MTVFTATSFLLLWYFAAVILTSHAANSAKASRNMKTRLAAKWYNFEICKSKPHSLVFKNYSSNMDKSGGEYCNVDFEITAPAQRLTALKLLLRRCPLGAVAECEYFNTWEWKVPPVCALLESKNMWWTPVIQNIHPKFGCPFRKGSYIGRNMTLDVAAVDKVAAGLNVEKFTWPIEVHMDSENGLYICFKYVMEVRRVRVSGN